MSVTQSVELRNARAACLETVAGASPILKIRTGAPPTNVAAASTGTVVATLPLPSDWLGAPSNGAVAKAGTWEDTAADDTGTAAHFEITKADGTTVVERGTVTATGGGGDMTVDNVSFAAGQAFAITGFTQTEGNAGT